MPWQGQKDNIIDRFDARAHLDFIPPVQPIVAGQETPLTNDERQANYERYRILAQNEFLGISEEKFLQQLYLEEQFGVNAQQEAERGTAKKAQKPQTGAAIGYTYEDSTGDYPSSSSVHHPRSFSPPAAAADEDESDSDLDVDVSINLSKLDVLQGNELNKFGRSYGMLSNDFYSFLTKDADEADAMRLIREEENEKVLMGGRKSRRRRREQREKRLIRRFQSPPSYAAREEDFRELVTGSRAKSPAKKDNKVEHESRSPSPLNSGQITYITSFGGEDEQQGGSCSSLVGIAKNQTISRLQQLKSQLTLGSIIEEKRKNVASEAAAANYKSKEASLSTAKKQTAKISTNSKTTRRRSNSKSPRRHRSRTRSRSNSRSRRDRCRRRRSSSSRSDSSKSSSDRDRIRRRSREDGDRRRTRRRSRSSSESDSGSSASSRRREKSRRRRKSSYRKSNSPPKLPKSSGGGSSSTTAVSLPKSRPAPVPPVVTKPVENTVKLPEAVAPVKKYYGRRKEDHSDSELSYSEEDQSVANPKKVQEEKLTESIV